MESIQQALGKTIIWYPVFPYLAEIRDKFICNRGENLTTSIYINVPMYAYFYVSQPNHYKLYTKDLIAHSVILLLILIDDFTKKLYKRWVDSIIRKYQYSLQ